MRAYRTSQNIILHRTTVYADSNYNKMLYVNTFLFTVKMLHSKYYALNCTL